MLGETKSFYNSWPSPIDRNEDDSKHKNIFKKNLTNSYMLKFNVLPT